MKREIKKTYEPAPLGRRTFAFLLDWYLGSAFSTIPVGLIWNILTKDTKINTDLTLFESPYGLLAGLAGLLFGAFYFYVVPVQIWNGQTLGKRLMGIRIVGESGEPLTAGAMMLRQVAGIMLLEGAFLLTGNYFTQMVSILTFQIVGRILGYVIVALFIISACLVWKDRIALHDMLAHSIVIENKQN